MPDADRVLTVLRQAIHAFRATPGRVGRVVSLNAEDVIVAGDMHGNVANFRALLQRAELPAHPRRHLVVQELIHGPHRYPAGGDRSHQLLDALCALKCQMPQRVHMLMGNHELAEWTDQRVMKENERLNDLFREGVNTAFDQRAAEVYHAYRQLFAVLPLALRTSNRVFLSHSLPSAKRLATFDPAVLEKDVAEPADLKVGGSVHSLLWGRDTSQANVDAFLKKVDADLLVSGHIPCDEGFALPNDRQLILDSMRTPASYCVFSADRPLTHDGLVAGVGIL